MERSWTIAKANIRRIYGVSMAVSSFPLLFDLGKPKPTTRQLADLIRGGGAAALSDAATRADQARYQEVRCRSALNRVKGMPFEWTLNPYRGCTHGCHYCYARRYHTQFELGAGDEFASIIFVKTNFVEVLRQELRRPSWSGAHVVVGAATDCYQPIEGHYRLTRGSLAALCEAKNSTGIITKGPMVVRDADILQQMTSQSSCTVCVSVPTVDDDVWQKLEPGTAPPMKRLRAVRELVDAGIHAGVLMNPIVPGISSRPQRLERTVKAIADHGAAFVGCNVLFLEGGTREHFLRFLAAEYPHLQDAYGQLYAGKYAPAAYRKEVSRIVSLLKTAHGIGDRRDVEEVEEKETPVRSERAEQGRLAWR
jgi:DNA repair photolyase